MSCCPFGPRLLGSPLIALRKWSRSTHFPFLLRFDDLSSEPKYFATTPNFSTLIALRKWSLCIHFPFLLRFNDANSSSISGDAFCYHSCYFHYQSPYVKWSRSIHFPFLLRFDVPFCLWRLVARHTFIIPFISPQGFFFFNIHIRHSWPFTIFNCLTVVYDTDAWFYSYLWLLLRMHKYWITVA